MSAPFQPPSPQPAAEPEPANLESLAGDFESRWRTGQRPSIGDYVPRAGGARDRLLIELVHAELELRLKAGEPARVEEYLQRFPELARDPATEWALLVAEYTQRARREPGLSLEEYLRRFPHRRADLVRWQSHPTPPADGQAPALGACTPVASTPCGWPGGRPAIAGYEILEELGRGGMGIVYRAWQVSLKRVVALKVIRAGAGPEELARFHVEAEAVARLRHPGIVQIHEVGEAAAQPYLTLEYVAGGSLSKRLDGTPWPACTAAALVRALAEAVHHAHTQGVVHRDLKPANVLLAVESGESRVESQRPAAGLALDSQLSTLGSPKITDFGLAKLLRADSDEHTRTGAVLGTPCYMAPEQASGRTHEIGPAADVHALGAILYELLTGRPPFRGESVEQTLQLVRSAEPVAPRRLQPRLGRDLETVCLKRLRKQPAERYASAADLAEDLRRHLDGEPVRARPPSAWRRGAAWARRRPGAAALLLAAVALTAAGIAGLSWHTTQLSTALEETDRQRQIAEANERRARQSAYASQMLLAQQSLGLGNVTVLPDLLDRYRPASPAAEEVRGFEWWYLAPHRRPAPRALRAFGADVYWLEYSPDGRLLAAAGGGDWNDGVRVWDAHTHELRLRIPLQRPTAGRGPPAAFGQGASGWLAVREGHQVTRWDLRAGQRLPDPLAVKDEVFAVAAHPDGRRLFVGSAGRVGVWDGGKTIRLATFPAPGGAEHVCLSGDGRVLTTVQSDGRLLFWDADRGVLRGQSVSRPGAGRLIGFPRSPFVLQVANPLARLATEDGSLTAPLAERLRGPALPLPRVLADGGRQEVVWGWGEQVSAPVTAAAVSPDEALLVTGHADGAVCFWDVPTRAFHSRLRWQSVPVTALAFSPDSKTLAAGAEDGMVYQLAPPSRQEPDRLRPALPRCADLAVAPDGQTVAVACRDRTVKLIDFSSGRARPLLRGLANPVAALAFAPDGRTLATREEGTAVVRLWDVVTGKERASVPGGACFAFAPGGGLLALGGEGLALVDEAGAPRGAVRHDRARTVALAFSPDGRTLAAADAGHTVELWDVASGRLTSAPACRRRLEGPVRSLALLPDGILATGEVSGQVRFWRAAAGTLCEARPPLPCGEPVNRLAMSPDGKTLLTQGPIHHARCWDWPALKSPAALHDYVGETSRVVFSPEPHRLAALSREGMVELWDCKTWALHLPPSQALWPVSALAFTPDGRTLVTAGRWPYRLSRQARFGMILETRALRGAATALRFWDPADGTERAGLDGPPVMAPPHLLALAPDGHTLAAGGADGSVWLWDRRAGGPPLRRFVSDRARDYTVMMEKLRAQWNTGNPVYLRDAEPLRSLAFSPDGRQLAAAGSRGTVTVWESGGAWREARRLTVDAAGPVWAAFAPGGELVVPCGGQIQFLTDGAAPRTLGNKEDTPAVGVAFAARGNLLVVAHQDRRIRLWDTATGAAVGELIGHLDQIAALAFSPDGKTLASGGHDHSVKLWSVTALAEVASLEQHRGRVFCVAFSPDGTTLASGGENPDGRGEVYLWRAPRP